MHLDSPPAVTLAALGTQSASTPQPVARTGPHWENLLYLGGVILGIIVAILLFRAAIRISKWFFMAAVVIFGGIWATSALYNRTEPAWLTPAFDALSEWLPTKNYQRADPAASAAGTTPQAAPAPTAAKKPPQPDPKAKKK